MVWNFVAQIGLSLLLSAVAYALTPRQRPDRPEPAGLDDFDFPTAEEGRAIPVVFGSVLLKGPNVVWAGDLQIEDITKKQKRFLRSSKRITVGYRYSLGMHMALAHGPLGKLREVVIDGKSAWRLDALVEAAEPAEPAVVLGAVGAISCVAGTGVATVTVADPVAGMTAGQAYLVVGPSGAAVEVFVQSVEAVGAGQTWLVTPEDTAFSFFEAVILEAVAGASAAGYAGGRIRIDRPDLFGGDDRDGGVVGDVDVLMGGPAQPVNDYLAGQLPAPVPAFRGVASLVLRGVYLGNSPFLRPWAIRVERTAVGIAAPWQPDLARIPPPARIGGLAIHLVTNLSHSPSGRATARLSVMEFLRDMAANADFTEPVDIAVAGIASQVVYEHVRRGATAQDFLDLAALVEAQPHDFGGSANLSLMHERAVAFWEGSDPSLRRVILHLGGGQGFGQADALAVLEPVRPVDYYCFAPAGTGVAGDGYLAALDNTPVDGVPVIPVSRPRDFVFRVRDAFGNGPDLNPAHILHDCLTDPDWGLGVPEADIGASFAAAAQALFDEEFGLSLAWQRDSSVEDFVARVLDHIDAALFIDPLTGLWELRLIRPDYDPASLPLFDEARVLDWGRLGRRSESELINSVTVRFRDGQEDGDGAVSVTDTARVLERGQMVSTTLEYPGVSSHALAARVAERDLRSLSQPIWTGDIVVDRSGAGLNPGDVIRVSSPRRGIGMAVMRVSEVSQGDGLDPAIRLSVAEDAFTLGTGAVAVGPIGGAASLGSRPRAAQRRYVAEAPYWLVAQEAEAVSALAAQPDPGRLIVAAGRPSSDALGAEVWWDRGSGRERVGTAVFTATCRIAAPLAADPAETVVAVEDWQGRSEVAVGALAALGDEIVRIDGVLAGALRLGRGCLDTPPRAHPAGTGLVLLDADPPEAEAQAGETAAVRLLPQTAGGVLSWSAAPSDAVAFDRRALRPLPVADFQVDGAFEDPGADLSQDPAVLTWGHRDRLAQVGLPVAAYLEPDAAPETGVEYAVELRWVDAATGAPQLPAAAVIPVGTALSHTLEASALPAVPAGIVFADVLVRARRSVGGDWVWDWQPRAVRIIVGGAGWGGAWGTYWQE